MKMKCINCMYLRYTLTKDGQKWYCRRESTDDVPILHDEDTKERGCTCGLQW